MIRTTRAPVDVAAVTHPGMAGKQNEDCLSVSSYRVSQNDPTLSVFAIVSDGIGGHRAGEVTAEMASVFELNMDEALESRIVVLIDPINQALGSSSSGY